MRLPGLLTRLSPVGETLEAVEQGVTLLEAEADLRNRQLAVSTAEDGLNLWERDYGLPGSGDTAQRRARVLAALAGEQTLTVEELAALAVSLGGADRGVVREDFGQWKVTLEALYDRRLPDDGAALLEAVERRKPAHLVVEVLPAMALTADTGRFPVATAGLFLQIPCRDGEI